MLDVASWTDHLWKFNPLTNSSVTNWWMPFARAVSCGSIASIKEESASSRHEQFTPCVSAWSNQRSIKIHQDPWRSVRIQCHVKPLRSQASFGILSQPVAILCWTTYTTVMYPLRSLVSLSHKSWLCAALLRLLVGCALGHDFDPY